LESGPLTLRQLYESDETAWLDETARLIETEQLGKLDYQSLKEYIQDMAIRDRREAKSRMRQLLIHLLKWEYQPRKRSRSWETTIADQRFEMQDILTSKTLLNHVKQELSVVYNQAVKVAMTETGLKRENFPDSCPYSLEFLLSEELPTKRKSNSRND